MNQQRSSIHGETAFTPMGEREEKVTVAVVMVPPAGDGKAWGHTESGTCVEFTGEKASLIALFHDLRAAGRRQPALPVIVDAAVWRNVRTIERTECPIHALPHIEEGSAVAFAPY